MWEVGFKVWQGDKQLSLKRMFLNKYNAERFALHLKLDLIKEYEDRKNASKH